VPDGGHVSGIDTGAGEKERGTLETLLLAPVSRTAIVLAKFLMLFTIGLSSALLMILSMGLLLHFFGPHIGGDLVLMVRASARSTWPWWR
jgi:sodium transport system permease protein